MFNREEHLKWFLETVRNFNSNSTSDDKRASKIPISPTTSKIDFTKSVEEIMGDDRPQEDA